MSVEATKRTRQAAVRPRGEVPEDQTQGWLPMLALRHMLVSTRCSDYRNHSRTPRVLEGSWQRRQAPNGSRTPTDRWIATPSPPPREGPIRPSVGRYIPLATKCARGDLNPHVHKDTRPSIAPNGSTACGCRPAFRSKSSSSASQSRILVRHHPSESSGFHRVLSEARVLNGSVQLTKRSSSSVRRTRWGVSP
jgi:hypothetical protein